MRIGLLFPGQGSLHPEALAPWRDHPAGAVVDEVGRMVGLDLWTAAADPAAGASTAVAQPAILAASLAAHRALTGAGIRPAVVAGHSLGEVTAAVAAGVLDTAAGATVVGARATAMAAACRRTPGTMAAVVRIDLPVLRGIVATVDDVVIANLNAPGQVVVAGTRAAVEVVDEAVRAVGGRVLPLDVEGAFHSPAMAPATVALGAALRRVPVTAPLVPLVTGTTGAVLRTGSDVERALVDGVLAPVRWIDVQQRIAAMDVDLLVECGPGKVLTGCAKRTVPDVPVVGLATPDDLERLLHRIGVEPAADLELVVAPDRVTV
ncbi:MAG: ACP S-malonyltransferase [Actinomycetes bacterium]